MTNQTVNRSTTEIHPGYLNIMGYLESTVPEKSEVNGPGSRAVVWVQGCDLSAKTLRERECPGCFNVKSWSFAANQLIAIDELADKIISNPHNTGVTLVGNPSGKQLPWHNWLKNSRPRD